MFPLDPRAPLPEDPLTVVVTWDTGHRHPRTPTALDDKYLFPSKFARSHGRPSVSLLVVGLIALAAYSVGWVASAVRERTPGPASVARPQAPSRGTSDQQLLQGAQRARFVPGGEGLKSTPRLSVRH